MNVNQTIKKNKSLVLLLLLLSALGAWAYLHFSGITRHRFAITFLNVGQGDSTLIRFETGEKMLVDCGPNRDILSVLGNKLFFYEREIDYLLITHPDLDHYGGCIDIIKRFKIKNIITNGKEKPGDKVCEELMKVIREEGAVVTKIDSPKILTISSSVLEFLSPDPSLNLDKEISDHNNYSLVFRLVHGEKKILFTGDIEEKMEQGLVKKYCTSEICPSLRSDILKVGHHGSDSSSSELFLRYVRPEIAVISVGKNKFGHPSRRVINHLHRAGAQIFRTDLIGDIAL